MSQRVQRSWDDPALKGIDLALREVDALGAVLDDVREDIREVTADARRDAITRWNATAGMSRRNTADRAGARRTTSRTQRYREAIRQVFFDDGRTGKVFVDNMRDSRFGNGVRPVNLPLWMEYGTRVMAARAHLIPAFELARRKLDRLIESRLTGAR